MGKFFGDMSQLENFFSNFIVLYITYITQNMLIDLMLSVGYW